MCLKFEAFLMNKLHPTVKGIMYFSLLQEPANRKLVPLLLGVTKDSILRLDFDSKEVRESFPLTTVKRWVFNEKIFSVDFGDFKNKNFSVQTTEGQQIANLIAGYVAIIEKSEQTRIQISTIFSFEKILDAKTALKTANMTEHGRVGKLTEPQKVILKQMEKNMKDIKKIRKILEFSLV